MAPFSQTRRPFLQRSSHATYYGQGSAQMR